MKIFRPGMPTVYVGEAAPPEEKVAEPNPLPSVAEAMKRADQRQTQILDYTRRKSQPSPLIQNPQPGDTSPGQIPLPHAINLKPEVQQ